MASVQKRPDRLDRITAYRRTGSAGRAAPKSSTSSPRVPPTMAVVPTGQAQAPALPGDTAPPLERPEFYTRDAAARRLGVGKTTIWELTRRGEIGVAYIGSKPVIPAVELERYIARLVQDARERAEASYRPSRSMRRP